MNNLEALQSEIQELELNKDVLTEQVKLKVEINGLQNDLREMGALYDFQTFMIQGAVVVAGVCSSIVFFGGKFFDSADKFLKWTDSLSK